MVPDHVFLPQNDAHLEDHARLHCFSKIMKIHSLVIIGPHQCEVSPFNEFNANPIFAIATDDISKIL